MTRSCGPLLCLLPLLSFNCWADAPGGGALNFLNMGGSARQSAMGGAGVSLGEEAAATQLNPANLSDIKVSEVYFSYERLFDDIAYGDLGYSRPGGRWGHLNLDLQYLTYGAVPGADAMGTRTGDVGASDRMFRLSWARPLETWAPALSLKVAQEHLDPVTATAFAFDAGMLYRPTADYVDPSWLTRSLSGLTFGAAVKNVGPGARFESAREKLPRSTVAGFSYRGFADSLVFALDAENGVGQREALILHAGLEGRLKDVLALRLGFRSDTDIGPGVSGGFGVCAGDLRLDYAFMPLGAAGDTHRVSASYRFGRDTLERYYQEGVREMRLGHYAEAVLLLDKALAIDPRDPRVLRKAMEAGKALENSLKTP